MTYEKTIWVDGQTPLNAENMNHIEKGIGQLSEEIVAKTIPCVFIDGEMPTSKDYYVLAELTYMNGAEYWHSYIEIKCQGTSSMSHPKKNFTVKLYEDEARTVKMKRNMFGWSVASNKFVLKADYIDHSHARNVISARLWSDIVASRSDYATLPTELRNSPNNGAVDGCPVLVYTNGSCQGVYNWNIGKEDWMWGMDEDNPNNVLLCAEVNTDGNYAETSCNFRALWSGDDGIGWSVEVGKNTNSVKTSLNNLISCVKDTDDVTFKATIGQYLDINSAIDYYLFQYFIFGSDNLAKNMLLATYDGVHWICGAYDLDATWGNNWQGLPVFAPTARIPEDAAEKFSLLWVRLEECFYDELKARYAVLRKGALSMANVIGKFDRYIRSIGEDLYAEDLLAYPKIPIGSENNLKYIREYARDRAVYVDEQISALVAPIRCAGISVMPNEVNFTTNDAQEITITLTPVDCNERVTYSSTNDSIAYGSDGKIYPVSDGNCVITVKCGTYSATVDVTVSAFSVIDYAHNALANAEWTDGSYWIPGGVTVAEVNSYRTANNNIILQDCIYKLDVANMQGGYAGVFAYDKESGTHVSSVEFNDPTGLYKDVYIMGDSESKYAMRMLNTSGNFDGSNIGLVAVDNRQTAVEGFEIDLSAVADDQLTKYNNVSAWKFDVTTQFAAAGLHNPNISHCNQINHVSVNVDGVVCLISAVRVTQTNYGGLRAILIQNTQTNGVWESAIVFFGFETVESCAAYLRENAVVVTINERH